MKVRIKKEKNEVIYKGISDIDIRKMDKGYSLGFNWVTFKNGTVYDSKYFKEAYSSKEELILNLTKLLNDM